MFRSLTAILQSKQKQKKRYFTKDWCIKWWCCVNMWYKGLGHCEIYLLFYGGIKDIKLLPHELFHTSKFLLNFSKIITTNKSNILNLQFYLLFTYTCLSHSKELDQIAVLTNPYALHHKWRETSRRKKKAVLGTLCSLILFWISWDSSGHSFTQLR